MISIFTPFHKKDVTFLIEAYESLKEQLYNDWQWVILLNGEGKEADISTINDQRVIIKESDSKGIGKLKKETASYCDGDILVELDYDDILTRDCLQEINAAFHDEKIMMAYSNFCEFNELWEPEIKAYNEAYGWKMRDYLYNGHQLKEIVAWEPSAHMMRTIEYAPNHVRAFRKSAYIEIKGHDDLEYADDHDLCCRFYLKYGSSGIKHINKCLYLYRVHENNTFKKDNQGIMLQTDVNYMKYSRYMAIKWANENNLQLIDLTGIYNGQEGLKTINFNLDKTWKLRDSSVGVLMAKFIFERYRNTIDIMNEAYRVLAPGGWLFIDSMSTDGRGAFQNPLHKSFWNTNSIFYFTNDKFANVIRPAYKGRFQSIRTSTIYENEFQKVNDMKVLQADLVCLKSPYSDHPVGKILC